jgi:hypothetical protein
MNPLLFEDFLGPIKQALEEDLSDSDEGWLDTADPDTNRGMDDVLVIGIDLGTT